MEEKDEKGYLFGPEVVPRVKKIIRLRQDLGVNLPGIGVVLELLERIDNLEARIRELEAMLGLE